VRRLATGGAAASTWSIVALDLDDWSPGVPRSGFAAHLTGQAVSMCLESRDGRTPATQAGPLIELEAAHERRPGGTQPQGHGRP